MEKQKIQYVAGIVLKKQIDAIAESPAVARVYETAVCADLAGELDSWPVFLEKIFPKPSFDEFQKAKLKVHSKIAGMIEKHEAKTT